jgi:GH24 family phage-related lysozyme (muramidase)
MITEGLQNIAQGFRNKFSRETVAATVGNPRNATRQMTQRKPAAVKAMGVKKPTVGKVGSIDTAFFTKVAEKKNPKLQKNDSVADVAGKLFSLIKSTERERKIHFELNRDFEKENIDEDARRHKELVEALKKQKEVKKPKKESKKKEEKKEPEKKAPEKAETKAKEEVKKTSEKAPEKAPAKAPEKAPEKAPAKAPEKAPEKVPEKAPEAPTAKPAPEAKPPVTAKPVEPAPAAPQAPTPTVTVPKPSIPSGVSTAAKVAVGAAAIGAVTDVKAMIMRHEGAIPYPYKDSKGLWTIGVGHLIGDGKTLPPEYSAWSNNKGAFDKGNNTTPVLTQKQMEDLFEEDYKKHEAIAKKGPGFNKADPEVQGAFVDLSFNMGAWWTIFKKAGKAAENGDFETAANELEKSLWYKQVGNRAKEVVALIRKGGNNSKIGEVNNTPSQPGSKIASVSTENEDLKKQGEPGTTVIMDNSQTNISQSTPSKQKTLAQGSSPDLPAHQQG